MSTSPFGPGDRPPAPDNLSSLTPVDKVRTRLRQCCDAVQRALDELDNEASIMQGYVRRQLNVAQGELHRAQLDFLDVENPDDDEDDSDLCETPLEPTQEEILDEVERSFKKTGGL